MKITVGIFRHPLGILKVTERMISFIPLQDIDASIVAILDWSWAEEGFSGTGTGFVEGHEEQREEQ